MTVNLPDDLGGRLAAEATRRGTSVDALVAELVAAQLPGDTAGETDERPPRRLSFIGIGASGGGDNVAERHQEIIREHFADKTAGDV